MSFEFIAFIFFLILAVAFVSVAIKAKPDEERSRRDDIPWKSTSKIVSLGLGFIAVIFLFFACAYQVPVNNIGIVTSFSAPTGRVTGNGLKFVWPWQRVADFDASRITENHIGDWDHGCTVVRIGSLATACVENRIQWQVVGDQAPILYKTYKGDFNNLKANFVDLEIQNALNATFATYNPLAQVDIRTGQTTFDGAKLAEDMKRRLSEAVEQFGIKIYTVAIPIVHHDAKTEENIKKFQDVVLQSRILDQQRLNADKEKAVSDKLRPVLTPEYVQNKCIEYSREMGIAPGLCMMNSGLVNVPTTKG